MAIQKIIQIDVDELKALGGIDNLNKAIGSTEQSTKSLRTQLREAQLEVATLSEKFGATSKEAVEAAKKAALLKDAIGDAKALTDAFNPDAKFKALSGSLVGVAGGFSAIQGALGTFGIESDNVEKALLKVNSAMALSQGLQSLGESIDSFKQLGAVAKNALSGIRTGLLATGLGAFVVVLGTVVAYWDDIKKAVDNTTDAQKQFAQSQEILNKAFEDSNVKKVAKDIEDLRVSIDLAKQGVISKKDALNQYNQTLGKAWGSVNTLDEAEQKLVKNANAYIRVTLLKAAANLALDKAAADMLKAEEQRQKKLEEFNNTFLDAPTNIRTEQDYKNYVSRITAARKQRQQEEIKIAEESAKKQTDIAKKFLEDAKKLEEQFNFTSPITSATPTKSVLSSNKSSKSKEDFKIEDSPELVRERMIAETRKAMDKEIADNKEKEEQRRVDAVIDANNKIGENSAILDEQEKALNEQRIKERYEMLDNLAYIFGAESDLGKAALIAKQILMAKELAMEISRTITFANLTGAKAVASSAAGAAETAKIGFPQNIPMLIGYAAQAAGIISAIKSALGKVKGAAGSMGGGGISVGNSVTPTPSPQFNIVGNTGVNQIAQTIAGQQPVKAYVVAKEVTTQQELDRNKITATRI